jgi:hypothetical protein
LWKQDGGSGSMAVTVDGMELPMSPHCGPQPSPGFMPFTCNWKTTSDGKRILVGTASIDDQLGGTAYKDIRSLFARYVTPEGLTVSVEVFGTGSNSIEEPIKSPPVLRPDVTIDQLIAAVTDPAMTLK